MRIYNPKKYFKRHGVAAQGRAQNFVPRQSLIFTLEIIIVCRVRSQKYFTLNTACLCKSKAPCNVRKWCITIFPQVASLSLEIATFDLIAFPATEQTGEVCTGLTQFILPPQEYILDMMCALTMLTKRPNFLSCYCV